MKIAVCDDTAACRKEAEENIRRLCGAETEIRTFSKGEALLAAFAAEPSPFDVVFLDIEMEGEDGIDTANEIRKTDKQVLILFITAYKRHALRSFECQPFRFLVKPVKEEIWKKTFCDIHKKLSDSPGTFVFTENKKTVRIFCDDILFFESRGHWLILHKKSGESHKILKSMKELCRIIDKTRFCRIHRAFMVNLNFVYLVQNTEITLHGYDKPLPVGRMYKKDFTECLLHFEERKYFL